MGPSGPESAPRHLLSLLFLWGLWEQLDPSPLTAQLSDWALLTANWVPGWGRKETSPTCRREGGSTAVVWVCGTHSRPRKVGCERLYSFSVVAVTNCQRLSGLKQHRLLLRPFWKAEILNGRQGCIPSRGSREDSFSVSFPSHRGHQPALACGSCLHLQSQWVASSNLSHSCFHHHSSFSDLTSLPPSCKDSCDDIGLTQIILDTLPVSGALP